MENANVLERRSDVMLYHHSLILGCFLLSLGACLAFLPNLPSDEGQSSSVKETTYSVLTALYIAVAFCVLLLGIYFVRNRENFHKSQLVLWPKRCQECARVLGMLSQNADSREVSQIHQEHSTTTSATTTNTLSSSTNGNRDTDWLESHPTSAAPTVNDEARSSTYDDFDTSYMNTADSTTNFAGLNLHSCLKNAFLFYSLLSLPGMLFLLIGQFFCLVQDKDHILSLSLKEVADISLLMFVPLSMKFFLNYYDAVFVSTAWNNACLGLFLSVGIWICVSQIKNPIAQLMECPYSKIGQPCNLNGTLGKVVDISQTFLTPIYTQCLIIAVAILWQMSTSVTLRAALFPSLGQHHFETRQSHSVRSWLQSVVHHSKMYVRHVFLPRRLLSEEQRVYPRIGGTSGLQEYVYKAWTLPVLMSGCNLILTFLMSYQYIGKDQQGTYGYMMQSIDMALVFPLILILIHERYIMTTQQPRDIHLTPMSSTHLGGHDILLILSSYGFFCKCIFRVSASIGLLFNHKYVEENGVTNPTFGIINSVFNIVWIWLSSTFLLRIQRHVATSITEIKVVLIGLIFIITIGINGLMFFVFVHQASHVEAHFFCLKTERVMSVVFTPFSILFYLCQAIIAFETYRVIIREVLAKGV